MSGYRHNRTKDLEITTYYDDVLSSLEGRPLEDFLIALSKSRVLSARLFDLISGNEDPVGADVSDSDGNS